MTRGTIQIEERPFIANPERNNRYCKYQTILAKIKYLYE